MSSGYTYSIFDANPSESSGTVWHTHDGIAFTADSEADAILFVTGVLDHEAFRCKTEDGYEVGQSIYALIWDEDGVQLPRLVHELSADELGTNE